MERRSKELVLSIEIYTDGSLKKAGSRTFGGWAYIVVKDSHAIYSDHGSELDTTNQRMELTAVAQALEYIEGVRKTNERVTIYSDSAYIVNCYLQDWWRKWQENGWRTSSGKDVANQDLWYRIVPFMDHFFYTFAKVSAHADSYFNNEVDKLVQSTAQNFMYLWTVSEALNEQEKLQGHS